MCVPKFFVYMNSSVILRVELMTFSTFFFILLSAGDTEWSVYSFVVFLCPILRLSLHDWIWLFA